MRVAVEFMRRSDYDAERSSGQPPSLLRERARCKIAERTLTTRLATCRDMA
jgi:hypothetical protein